MRQGEGFVVHMDMFNRVIPVTILGEVLGEDAQGSITIEMTSVDARLAAKRLVEEADKIDIHRFLREPPLQRVDCE
jgi:hypothetical protein